MSVVAGGDERPARGWLRPFGPARAPVVELVVCPHAGGNADFVRDWPAVFGADVCVTGVQYPGHGDRLDEPCLTDIAALSEQLAAELSSYCGRIVLMGHSFGAAVAYETAALLTGRGTPPRGVIVSGRRAPHLDGDGTARPLADDEIWRETVRLGGTPAEIAADPQWREFLIPALRADFDANAAYHPSRRSLSCALTALVGRHDRDVPAESVDAWRAYTTSTFAARRFDGGHFYLVDHVAEIAAEVTRLASDQTSRGRNR